MRSMPIRLATLISALALGQAFGQGSDGNAFLLDPTRVDANKAATLGVVSHRYSCAATYSDKTLQRTGNRISVRFVPVEKPDAVCPGIFKPYGPTFDLPALPQGRYDVYATPLLPCHVAPQPCEAPEKEERVGYLTVGPAADAEWFVSPASAAPARAFSLRVLSEKYGNCGTTFEHASLETSGNTLRADFVIKTDPSVVCVVDIHPHGPTFQVQGLAAGKYPVGIREFPACAYDPQPCPFAQPLLQIVDTLLVTGITTSLGPDRESPGAGPQASGASGQRAGLRRVGGTVAVTLPGRGNAAGPGGTTPGQPGKAASGNPDMADMRGRQLK